MKITVINRSSVTLLSLLFFLSALAETKVAVYITGDIPNEKYKKVFASKLVSAVTKIPEYTAIELNDSFIDAVVYEHNRQASDGGRNEALKEDSLYENGKKYGAKYIAAIELTELLGETFVSSHLIDVETAKVIRAFDTQGNVNNLSQLVSLADSVADGLIAAPFRKEEERKAKIRREAQERQDAINRKKEEEAREERQRARQANLRRQAIANLTPAGWFIFENYLVQKEPEKVHIYGRNKSWKQPEVKLYSYYSNDIADEMLLRKLANAGYLPDGFYITDTSIYTVDNYKSSYCTWYMSAVGFDRAHNKCTSGDKRVCATKWGNGLDIITEYDVYAIIVKKAPREFEIQDEIKRLISQGY